MPDSTHSSIARLRWMALCLTLVLGGCDPLGLASLFDKAPAMGTSVLTLLDTQERTLELGDEFVGALSAADFVGLNGQYLEAWALEGEEGQSFSIDLISHDFDSHLYVVGPGLSETLSDDDSGGACHARVQLTVLESGTFHVVASSSSSNQMGTYQLTVSEESRPRAAISCGGLDGSALTSLDPAGRVLLRGETSFGSLSGAEPSIENSRPVQAWTLEGQAGETVVISLRSDDYDSYLYFFGPGMVEALTNDDGGSGLNSELTVTFSETGVYTVGAAALSSGSTGSYDLTVTDPIDLAELSTEGRRLSVGMDSYAMLTDLDPVVEGKPVQAWAFQARAGQRVTVDLMSEDFDSYLRVVGPGLSLTDDDGGDDLDSRLVVTFPQDGEYRIIASSLGGSTGSFTLQVR